MEPSTKFREAMVRKAERALAGAFAGPKGGGPAAREIRRAMREARRVAAKRLVDACMARVGQIKVWLPSWAVDAVKRGQVRR